MSLSPGELILPRPGAAPDSSRKTIPGPAEADFTNAFGALLPPAKFLETSIGKAAYYELPPPSPGSGLDTLNRVLFVHGVQTPTLGMFPLARALQASFPHAHIVLVDLWGHGLSDTPFVPHNPGLFHGLIDDLLDKLDWPSAHLVGYSFGGALTAGYVVLRPSRVQSFTLVAPAGLLHSTDFSAEEQGYLRGGDEAGAKKWILRFLEGGELVVPADWRQRVEKGEVVAEAVREWQMVENPGHVASVVAIFRDGGVMDLHEKFAKAASIGIPSFVVLGELDDLCSQQQLNELGFVDVVVVPQVGHAVVRERAPEVATLVGEFWSRLP
ncbi:hypothetical protein AK830_g1658 [Neonectria ditissima]|uniref:AB hydrolase-1 domain-containing protein n=1 Tax=Neonectria ditissima TaxID=78410 RepID=A0A0P7BU50_9HYPO|nr:hypothetical protein AK830_g1658 [Neonectria ditissima]